MLGQPTPDEDRVVKSEVWLRGQIKYSFDNQWSGATNMDHRIISTDTDNWTVQSYTQDVILQINPGIELVGALRLFRTNNDDLTNSELRPALGLRMDVLRTGRLTLRNYFRYEYRQYYYQDDEFNNNTFRLRNRLFGSVALNNASPVADNTLSFRFALELFAEPDFAEDQFIMSRYRLEAGFGYRINAHWNINLRYFDQGSRSIRGGDFNVDDNIVFLTTTYSIFKSRDTDD